MKLLTPATPASGISSEPEIGEPAIRGDSSGKGRKRRLTSLSGSLPCRGENPAEVLGASDLIEAAAARVGFMDRMIDGSIRRAVKKALPPEQEDASYTPWWQQERLQAIVSASKQLLEERVRELATKDGEPNAH